ncbi:MAG: cytidylyltransferase domain-containing protein [Flavobacteriales bacterium]
MIVCIIQARMGSSRLPGKVLRQISEKPILQHVIDRLGRSKKVGQFIVATTIEPADDAIELFCTQHHIPCYRGSEWDVLDRFYQAAISVQCKPGDTIVRICCDNPIHSHHVLDFAIDQFEKLGLDYFSNSNQEPHFLEDGFDVEVASFNALETATREASMLSEREHVMPYIKNAGKFRIGWRKAHASYTFKLSVDTEKDLEVVQAIFHALKDNSDFSIGDVVELLQRSPQILALNADSEINSGYKKSLREDRRVN